MTRLTLKQGRELLAKLHSSKPTKYRNTKVKGVDAAGNVITLDSKAEARRWGELLVMSKQGLIQDLQRQVRFKLDVAGHKICTYVADFTYRRDGNRVVEDVKGTMTPTYRLKKKLMLACHGVEICEVS
jgi:hypothetical protein